MKPLCQISVGPSNWAANDACFADDRSAWAGLNHAVAGDLQTRVDAQDSLTHRMAVDGGNVERWFHAGFSAQIGTKSQKVKMCRSDLSPLLPSDCDRHI